MRRCPFCDAVENDGDIGNTFAFHAHLGDKVSTRILRETENFVIFPSIGQIVEGYLLIMPKDHYLSTAHLPDAWYDELEHLCEETRQVLSSAYCPPIFFEHGPMSFQQTGGCCVDHAHIHAVPVSLNLAQELRKHFTERRITNLNELKNQFVRGVAYLFFEDAKGNRYVYDAPLVPSQYLRQLVASKIGLPERQDWRMYPGEEEMLNTLKTLAFWKNGIHSRSQGS